MGYSAALLRIKKKRIFESADQLNYTPLHFLLHQGWEMEAVAIIGLLL